MEKHNISIGKVLVKGPLVVTSPVFTLKPWWCGYFTDMKLGLYDCFVSRENLLNTSLVILHQDYKNITFDSINLANFDVHVDSESIGIFNKDYYNKFHINNSFHEINQTDNTRKSVFDEWYSIHVDSLFVEDRFASITDGLGVVCRVSKDKHFYNCYMKKDSQSLVIGIRVELL